MWSVERKAAIVIVFLCHVVGFSQTNEPGGASTASTRQGTLVSLQDAIDRALGQASNYRSSQLGVSVAREDIRQARAAFLPKVTAPLNFIYTSPSLGGDRPRPPSYLGANAVTEYQVLVNAAGEIDTSGRLRATLLKDQALLEAARAGTEVAKRDLVQAVTEAYFNLELSIAKRSGAEANLQTARDFENITKLNLDAGEVAPVDLVRARLQTASRQDELDQAISDESVNAYALKALIGQRLAEQITVEDLMTQVPVDNEIDRFAEAAIATRPELAQFAAQRRAAELDIKSARAERRPQLTYSVSNGFIADSLRPGRIKDQMGVQATVGFTMPIFDWGASRSRETQAQLRLQQTETARSLAERQFAQEFFAARTQATAARERIRRLAASIGDAETNVTASAARYRAGEATIAEPIDAQNQLITIRQALRQAIFDYQTAKARLARAVGQ